MRPLNNHLQPKGLLGVLRIQAEYRLVASEKIPAGTPLFAIEGEITSTPTRYSVQIGHNIHIDLGEDYSLEEILDCYSWRFMNHHCEPNTFIRERQVFALREILPWEEITFNYNTTEYTMAEPFSCRCGSETCQGVIRGFSGLSTEEQLRLRPWLAAHLLCLIQDSGSEFLPNTLPDTIKGSLNL